jgi:hypothetical protein
LNFTSSSPETTVSPLSASSSSSSNNFLRNSIIVPSKCIVNRFCFSIKELSRNVEYTATLFVNGNSTNVNAVITDGSTQFSIVTNSNFQLNELDLISIKVEWEGGALNNGVTSSLLCNE